MKRYVLSWEPLPQWTQQEFFKELMIVAGQLTVLSGNKETVPGDGWVYQGMTADFCLSIFNKEGRV